MHKLLVRQRELATDVRVFVGPFRDPGLFEIFASARDGHRAEEMLEAIDAEIERVRSEAIPVAEIERARARIELGLWSSLETVDGKASTLGFYEVVLGQPNAAFERMALTARLGPSDLLRAARRYLDSHRRSIVIARPQKAPGT
jgi:zinc protease